MNILKKASPSTSRQGQRVCSTLTFPTADAVIRSEGQKFADRPQRDDGFLSDFFEDDDPQLDDFQQILLQIKNVVDCLMRLAVTIRTPAPHEQFKARMPALVSSFDAHHLRHVQQKFPQLKSKTIEEKLAKSLTYRRVFLKYREEHHERLKEGIEDARDDERGESRGGVTTEASWLPKDKHQDSNSRTPVFQDDISEMTATSYAPSCTDGSELRIPRIPSEYVDGSFICPYCYLPVVIENRHQWKWVLSKLEAFLRIIMLMKLPIRQHVFGDLRPYICLEDTCHLMDNSFARRRDWITHMTQEHWRTWTCPFGCAGPLFASSFLLKHLRLNHGFTISNSDINLHSRPNMELMKGLCPLCWEYEIMSSRQYQHHVGNHLEQLALFVLPDVEEAGEEADEEENSASESDQQPSDHDGSPIENNQIEEADVEDSNDGGSVYYEGGDESQPNENAQKRTAEDQTSRTTRLIAPRSMRPPSSRSLDTYNRRIADFAKEGIYDGPSVRKPVLPPPSPIQPADPIERPPARIGHRKGPRYQYGPSRSSQSDASNETRNHIDSFQGHRDTGRVYQGDDGASNRDFSVGVEGDKNDDRIREIEREGLVSLHERRAMKEDQEWTVAEAARRELESTRDQEVASRAVEKEQEK